jgi:hypothetical protein
MASLDQSALHTATARFLYEFEIGELQSVATELSIVAPTATGAEGEEIADFIEELASKLIKSDRAGLICFQLCKVNPMAIEKMPPELVIVRDQAQKETTQGNVFYSVVLSRYSPNWSPVEEPLVLCVSTSSGPSVLTGGKGQPPE